GAAILAAGRGVGLLERLEDDLLLLERDADAGVGDLERNYGLRLVEDRVIRAPAALRERDVEADAALRRGLERVRQQVLQHLLQTFGVGDDAAADARIEMRIERERSRLRLVTERTRHHVDEVGEVDLLGVDRDGSGLDLGQVENVADQVEQV